jgi:hypothetical protein
MELLTLNLHSSLEWSRDDAAHTGIRGAAEASAAIALAPEGAEIAIRWEWDTLVGEHGGDGPRVTRPLPAPAFTAMSGLPLLAGSTAPASGLPAGMAAASGAHADVGEPMRMEPGRYLFVQTRAPASGVETQHFEDWLADTVEWFAREAWWTGTQTAGPLVVRFVQEDSKTAVQVIRRLA